MNSCFHGRVHTESVECLPVNGHWWIGELRKVPETPPASIWSPPTLKEQPTDFGRSTSGREKDVFHSGALHFDHGDVDGVNNDDGAVGNYGEYSAFLLNAVHNITSFKMCGSTRKSINQWINANQLTFTFVFTPTLSSGVQFSSYADHWTWIFFS